MDHEEDPDTRSIAPLLAQLEELRRQREATTVAETRTDLPFDEYLNVEHEEPVALFNPIFQAISRGSKRAANEEERARLLKVVGCVIANAILAREDAAAAGWVHYSRNEATYRGRSPYYPHWLGSKLLIRVIDRLTAAGLLVSQVATATLETENVVRSTYKLSTAAIALIEEIGVGLNSITRDHDSAPVVFLSKGELERQKYDPEEQLIAPKIAFLRSYNTHLKEQKLGISDNGLPLTPQQQRRTQIYRRYKNSFQEHGRFYGGWWEVIDAEQRQFITINGESTVELDYSSLQPRLLYHLNGLEFEGDAYDIPEIMKAAENDGLDKTDVRKVIKTVFYFKLNSKRRGGYHKSKAFKGWPPSLSRKDGLDAIERKHKLISNYFYKNQSLKLMNIDSEICEIVLSRGLNDGITVLPIHDSFIVQQRNEEWLRGAMRDAYRDITGRYPVIV